MDTLRDQIEIDNYNSLVITINNIGFYKLQKIIERSS